MLVLILIIALAYLAVGALIGAALSSRFIESTAQFVESLAAVSIVAVLWPIALATHAWHWLRDPRDVRRGREFP